MLIIMKANASPEDQDTVVQKVSSLGLESHVIPGPNHLAIGITGNDGPLDDKLFLSLPSVQNCVRVTQPYKLVSRDFKAENTVIRVGDVEFGGNKPVMIAGPCAIESYDQTLRIARAVQASGARVLRGGAFKPRTSPYSFQGMGLEGLKILKQVSNELLMPTITEATDLLSLEMVYEYADIIQIGARNMQNFGLLQAVGKLDKPVLLKRGPSATVDEVLCSAEYIYQNGNKQVMLCERGLRNFDSHTRNLLDLAFVPVAKSLTHLPVLVDPSHATGRRDIIPVLSKAALAVGADGLIVEVHDRPDEAKSDGPQALLPETFQALMSEVRI